MPTETPETPETLALFDAAYAMPGAEGCRRLVELYDRGLHDFRDKVSEKEMTHRSIAYLADALESLARKN